MAKIGLAQRQGMCYRAKTEADRRFVRLVDKVYWRLPVCDRHVLRERILAIHSLDAGDQERGKLGSASPAALDSYVDGIQAVYEEEEVVQVPNAEQVQSDAAVMFIIAHEFAHVVLRHCQMLTTAGNLNARFPEETYSDEALESLREWHEDHADLQVWIWGFQDEMAAFLQEFPKARRSRWYIEAHWEKD